MASDQDDLDTSIPTSTFFVFWPGDEPPMPEEIRVRLEEFGATVDTELADAEETLWSFRLEIAERPVACLLWCEPLEGSYLRLLDGFEEQCPEAADAARDCRWMVGIEAPLMLGDPVGDFKFQLSICDAVGRGVAPVVYDASCFRFRTADEVRVTAENPNPPPLSSLYTVHRVPGPERGRSTLSWLHTHGLERTGVPELEILAIDERRIPAACELIEAVAELWLEYTTPPARTPFFVGEDLQVSWRPWQAVAMDIDARAPGGWSFRKPEFAHLGYRAVLETATPPAERERRARPPIDVLDRLADAGATLYRTGRETRRQAARARDRWGDFGLLFASPHPTDWRFAVKLGFPIASEPTPTREHLWFDVLQLKPGRIYGSLVSEPVGRTDLVQGSPQWHDLGLLTDWRIVSPSCIYDPETAGRLLETV